MHTPVVKDWSTTMSMGVVAGGEEEEELEEEDEEARGAVRTVRSPAISPRDRSVAHKWHWENMAS